YPMDRLVMSFGVMIIMPMTNGCHSKEDQSQHGKDQSLHGTHQDFKRIEWDWNQEGDQESHGRQHHIPSKDVTKDTKSKTENARHFTNCFEDTNEDVNTLHKALARGIPEFAEVARTQGPHTLHLHHHHGGNCKGKGDIQIGARGTEERHKVRPVAFFF